MTKCPLVRITAHTIRERRKQRWNFFVLPVGGNYQFMVTRNGRLAYYGNKGPGSSRDPEVVAVEQWMTGQIVSNPELSWPRDKFIQAQGHTLLPDDTDVLAALQGKLPDMQLLPPGDTERALGAPGGADEEGVAFLAAKRAEAAEALLRRSGFQVLSSRQAAASVAAAPVAAPVAAAPVAAAPVAAAPPPMPGAAPAAPASQSRWHACVEGATCALPGDYTLEGLRALVQMGAVNPSLLHVWNPAIGQTWRPALDVFGVVELTGRPPVPPLPVTATTAATAVTTMTTLKPEQGQGQQQGQGQGQEAEEAKVVAG